MAFVTESGFVDATEPALSNTVVVPVTSADSLLLLVNGTPSVVHTQDVTGATTASLTVVRIP